MFESRHHSTGGSANRWLIVAGAGLVILAFVARMLLDIGHTRVSDLAAAMRPDTAPAAPATPAPLPPVASTDSATSTAAVTVPATPPPVLKTDTAPQPAARPVPAPPVKPASTPTPAPPATGGTYAVQIGAFGSEANARKLGDRAAALGYQAQVTPQVRGATTLYLVRIEGLAGAAGARQAADSLQRALAVKAVVLPPGK